MNATAIMNRISGCPQDGYFFFLKLLTPFIDLPRLEKPVYHSEFFFLSEFSVFDVNSIDLDLTGCSDVDLHRLPRSLSLDKF